MKPIKITETVLRDAHQSLAATRMSTQQMLPKLELFDQAGYFALEMWGGATFDSALRFLNEDPWDRLRTIRKVVKNTKLMMLLRGQNILGYKHYPDDVVREFVRLSVKNGIDIIRVFDALNDLRNVKVSMEATKEYGAHAQGSISYTTSPVHNVDLYVNLALELQKMGADSLCIKDMSGLLLPYEGEKLVKAIKAEVDLPLEVHSHMTSGLADMLYIKCIEAGADIVDTALAPFAMGTSQPPTESLVMTLQGTPHDTQMDMEVLLELGSYFRQLKNQFVEDKTISPLVLGVDIQALWYQVPGGMLSNLVSQMNIQNTLEKLPEVLEEIPKVRKELGYPPLVTPTSQLVGAQAVINVMGATRYSMIPTEVRNYVKGMYGRPPAPIDEDIKKLVLGNEEAITVRPADLLEPALPRLKEELGDYYRTQEDLLSYALFPQVALNYFKNRP